MKNNKMMTMATRTQETKRRGCRILLLAPFVFFFFSTCIFGFQPQGRRIQHAASHAPFSLAASSSSSPEWHSGLSLNTDYRAAVQEILQGIPDRINENDDCQEVAFLFVGRPHATHFSNLVGLVKGNHRLQNTRLVSALGGGVVGQGEELDNPTTPGLSLLIGCLPSGANVDLVWFNALKNPPPTHRKEWSAILDGSSPVDGCLVFGDPWSPMDELLQGLDQQSTTLTSSNKDMVVAGAITCPSTTLPSLALDAEPLPQGSAVAVLFRGAQALSLEVMVAQGCRPIGPVYTITSSEGNFLEELDGTPALQALEEMAATVSDKDKECMSRGPAGGTVLCGIASAPTGTSTDKDFTRSDMAGDFLVRQMIGMKPQTKALVVAGDFRVGDLFQFHVRDGEAAMHDLDLMIQRVHTERLFAYNGVQEQRPRPLAALQFACVGRGRSLFGQTPNVDLQHVQQLLLPDRDPTEQENEDGTTVAVAGFYANGEIGPVGIAGISSSASSAQQSGATRRNVRKTFLHGFTLVAVILCDTSKKSSQNAEKATVISSVGKVEPIDDNEAAAWA